MPKHNAFQSYDPVAEWGGDADVLARHQTGGGEQEAAEIIVPPVNEVHLLAGERDVGDLPGIKSSAGRQNTSHIEVEVGRGANRWLDERDQPAGPEMILRNDRH